MKEATMTLMEFVDAAKRLLLGLVPAALGVTCVIVLWSVIARADPLGVAAKPWPAPIGHVQSHANDFSPGSSAEQAVQDRLSTRSRRSWMR
jgi:hypothetical protein